MPFNMYRTTAEDIVGATDATLQKQDGADENLVADFLDIPVTTPETLLAWQSNWGLSS